MSYDDEFELEVRGEFRAVIGYDNYPEPPDWDGQGTVIQLESRYGRTTADVVHHRRSNYRDGSRGDDFGIAYAWGQYRDMQLVERYLRIWHGVVGFDYFDTQDSKFIVVVTEDDLKDWGFTGGYAEWCDRNGDLNPADHILNAWQAYVDGDVYYYDVQQRAHYYETVIDFTGSEVRGLAGPDDWESIDGPIHGFYGREDVEQEAISTLDHYTKEVTTT